MAQYLRLDSYLIWTIVHSSIKRLKRLAIALWSKIIMNPHVGTGPLARSFTRLFRLLTHLLALYCSLCSSVCSLTHSLARREVNDRMAIYAVYFLCWTIMLQRLTVVDSKAFTSPSVPSVPHSRASPRKSPHKQSQG